MKSSGLDVYVGTIDANMIKDVATIAYYIEAQDKDGALAETPWYTVEFRKAESAPAVAGSESKKDDGMSWKTVGLIGAGVAAVVVGAVAIGGSGSSGGGGGGGGGTSTNVVSTSGTYNGIVTTCLTGSGGTSPSCNQNSCTIIVDSKGVVFSDTLLPGQQMTGSLSGNNFILSGHVLNQGSVSNGVINYDGTVVNGEISGSVNGSASTSGGPGNYSGSFSASKQ